MDNFTYSRYISVNGTQKDLHSRGSAGGGCQTCPPQHALSARPDIMKVHERERLSQPDAGGIIEEMMCHLDLEEKKSY